MRNLMPITRPRLPSPGRWAMIEPGRLGRLAPLLLAILLTPSGLSGATILGTARTEHHQPIRRVEVTIEPTEPEIAGAGAISASTDKEGKFRFDDVEPGNYLLKARKRGWGKTEIPLAVSAGDARGELQVDLVMNLTLLSRVVARVQLGILVYVVLFGLLALVTNYWIAAEPSGEVTVVGWGFILASILVACIKLDWAQAGVLAGLAAIGGGLIHGVGGRMAACRLRQVKAERQREADQRRQQEDKLTALIGKEGITLTDLKPCGSAAIDGETFDVRALQGLIPHQTRVVVKTLDRWTLVVDCQPQTQGHETP